MKKDKRHHLWRKYRARDITKREALKIIKEWNIYCEKFRRKTDLYQDLAEKFGRNKETIANLIKFPEQYGIKKDKIKEFLGNLIIKL